MIKKYFIQQVVKELRALKKNATEKELGKLDFESFNSANPNKCIYGQMTGHCRGRRAKILINKCCLVKIDTLFLNIKNTKEIKEKIDGGLDGLQSLYSYLEAYTVRHPHNPGATNTCSLKGRIISCPPNSFPASV